MGCIGGLLLCYINKGFRYVLVLGTTEMLGRGYSRKWVQYKSRSLYSLNFFIFQGKCPALG